MITGTAVCDAIAAAVARLWPDRMIYRDFCPMGHQRPSSYLYMTQISHVSANAFLVEWTMEASLELFCTTDEYDISSTEELRADQEAVLLAFLNPSFRVGDGWVTLTAKGEGMEMGSAFVTFSASWYEALPEQLDPGEDAPLMEHFQINGNEIKMR